MIRKTMLFIMIVTVFALVACSSDDEKAFTEPFDGSIEHVHGMGYAGNDEGLYIASHTGLKIYRDGEWLTTTKNLNDYMGFNAVDDGFYASRHPGEDSNLPNPLGIQRSFDGGKTLENIGFKGETDFHGMAVGYHNHAIFLMNPEENSELKKGFYISDDNGDTWKSVEASGLEGELYALAIHPDDTNYVAAATTTGIYFSDDAGNSFASITGETRGTAVYFTKENLYYGVYGSGPSLVKYSWKEDKHEDMNLPELTGDGPVYIAKNPNEDKTFAIYTVQGNAFLTEDNTVSWEQILADGKVK